MLATVSVRNSGKNQSHSPFQQPLSATAGISPCAINVLNFFCAENSGTHLNVRLLEANIFLMEAIQSRAAPDLLPLQQPREAPSFPRCRSWVGRCHRGQWQFVWGGGNCPSSGASYFLAMWRLGQVPISLEWKKLSQLWRQLPPKHMEGCPGFGGRCLPAVW